MADMTIHPQDSATPAHNQQVITAVAFIHKIVNGQPRVLLARRSLSKKFLPGMYELPGGHIDFGEETEEGLKRELKEELGIDIVVGMPFAAHSYINKIKGSHSIEVVYFARLLDDRQTIRLNKHDHSEIMWARVEDLSEVEAINGADDKELPHLRFGLGLLSGESIRS